MAGIKSYLFCSMLS